MVVFPMKEEDIKIGMPVFLNIRHPQSTGVITQINENTVVVTGKFLERNTNKTGLNYLKQTIEIPIRDLLMGDVVGFLNMPRSDENILVSQDGKDWKFRQFYCFNHGKVVTELCSDDSDADMKFNSDGESTADYVIWNHYKRFNEIKNEK